MPALARDHEPGSRYQRRQRSLVIRTYPIEGVKRVIGRQRVGWELTLQREPVREHDQRHGAQRSGGRRVAYLREALLEVDPLKLGIVLELSGGLGGELVIEAVRQVVEAVRDPDTWATPAASPSPAA